MNDNSRRTTGIILVILTILLCACPGLISLFAGGLTALISFIPGADIDIIGSNDPRSALLTGIGMLCLGVFLVAIPAVIALVTLRGRPSDDVPPAAVREPNSVPPVTPTETVSPPPTVEPAPPEPPASTGAAVFTIEEPPAEPERADVPDEPGVTPVEGTPDEPEEDEDYIPPAI